MSYAHSLLVGTLAATLFVGCKKHDKDPSATAAKTGEPAAAKPAGDSDPCAAATFKNPSPAFCLTLPSGFKAGAASGNFMPFDGPGGSRVAISWNPPDQSMKLDDVFGMAGDGTVVEKGDLPGRKGKFIVYDEKGNPTRHVEVLVQGAANVFRCASNGDTAGLTDAIAVCKSLGAS